MPSPDYPLWTAAVNLNTGARGALSLPRRSAASCRTPRRSRRWSPAARARIVIVNPNNPTGAVYPRETLAAIARIAEKHRLVVLSDEIYDQILYDGAEFVPMATLVHGTLCCTMSGLSKVYRACGYRVGWAVFSGDVENADRVSERPGTAQLAAAVQQRARTVGGADGARRPSEHSRADAPGRASVRVAADHSRRRRAQQVSQAGPADGRPVCLRRGARRRAAGLRRPGVCARSAWRTSTCW